MDKHAHKALWIAVTTGLLAVAASAAPPMPNEFDLPTDALDPLFAYFGGVQVWGTTPSTTIIHSGDSLEVWATLVDDIFSVAGWAVGTWGTTDLAVEPGADTFSITIEAPTEGQISVAVTLREDDNGDGVIDAGSDDDQWESQTILLDPGTAVYNIALADFVDANEGVGDGVPNLDTTGRVAYMLIFESRDSYPGGQIVGPVSFLIDHVGAYVGPQSLPAGAPGDLDGDGIVGITDLLELLAAWGPCSDPCPPACVADLDGDCVVGITDLLALLAAWG